VTNILVLCTANRCRSPMAQALLTRRLPYPGVAGQIRSAGVLRGGEPPPREVVRVMAAYGLDVSAHRSRVVGEAELASADLVLAMGRAHLRHAVIASPQVWPRVFTLKELVRRGKRVGRRLPGEPVAAWLERVHEGRQHRTFLGDSPEDDVNDPFGGPLSAYAAAAAVLDGLVAELADTCWGCAESRLKRHV